MRDEDSIGGSVMNPCKGCIYSFVTNCGTYCQYILITEHRRPCPPGKGCTVKKVQKGVKNETD